MPPEGPEGLAAQPASTINNVQLWLIDDCINIASRGIISADPINVKAIASLCHTATAPLSRQALISQLRHFGDQYIPV